METVLIVDDFEENLYFLEALLTGNGFQVRSARNGVEALQSAREVEPVLIVSDILMPVMDGYALCREWRADEKLRTIPFIFYTATFIDKKDENLALSLGADRFVIKPQEPDVFMNLIREVLARTSTGNAPVALRSPEAEEELLAEYNEALFRKLEKKMADLERTNRELEQTMAEQKRLEEQLRQVQKIEAIGRFSAGIAHDFNNILTVIIGFGSTMQLVMPADDPLRDKMDHILAAADRAKNLTRSLLTFSRKEELKLEPLDLNDSVRRVDTFLRRIIGEDLQLAISLREKPVMVYADNGHIEQVLMNLAANARDAMPDGGTFTIGTDVVEVDDTFVSSQGYGAPGRYAVLTVADTGIGMDETTRERIFEPFFTTKEMGHGTGLGLSIIYGIISQHKGHISVHSIPRSGTTFKILLPLMEPGAEFVETKGRIQTLPGGTETVLVVDDEAPIREYLDSFLSTLGYTALLARDGREAVDLFRERNGKVDLVLMDVVMPGTKGRDAARDMKQMKGDVKILFTSGYPYDLIREKDLLETGSPLLLKPLMPVELAQAVRSFIDGNAGNVWA